MAPSLPVDLERELFAAALKFRHAEPWRGLYNAHFLLVAEPDGGRRVLVVLGNGREQYGLQGYAAGCAAQFLVLLEELPRLHLASPTILFELLEGQEVEFTGKGEMDQADLARAARCDHRPAPRTRQAWPRFRAFRPNRFSWHIDEGHARLLLSDLQRATRWAALVPTLHWTDLGQPVALRRLPVVRTDLPTNRPWTPDDLTWERLVMPPAPAVPRLVLDPSHAAEWRALPLDPELELIVDERAPLIRIGDDDGGAPHFPRVGLCLDNRTGLILGQSMGASMQPLGLAAQGALDSALGALQRRPGRIFFINPSLPKALAPWLQAAELKTALAKAPPQLEELWRNLG